MFPNRGIEEMPSTSERRLAQNAYNILKQKGADPFTMRLICNNNFLSAIARVFQNNETRVGMRPILATPFFDSRRLTQ